MVKKLSVGILISGRGSNMQALIEAAKDDNFPAEIAVVISNRPKAAGLDLAKSAGIPTEIVDHKSYETREAFEDILTDTLNQYDVKFVCNAGFMRLLTNNFVSAWHNRHLNIHPSLLPSFKGLNTHARALDTGVKIAGCTVHFVRNEMDEGPIVIQAAVPVLEDDTEDTLAARILKAEHKIYPEALRLIASGEARITGQRVIFNKHGKDHPPLIAPVDV